MEFNIAIRKRFSGIRQWRDLILFVKIPHPADSFISKKEGMSEAGANSYRGIRTFINVQLKRLNKAFNIGWKRPPAHTAIRYILQGLNPADVEKVFREHVSAITQFDGPVLTAFDGQACGTAVPS